MAEAMERAPSIVEIAPAKINLFLHVGALRPDKFHDLESLFVFAEDGDRLEVFAAENLSLDIGGPFAEELADAPVEENLVWRAAEALREAVGVTAGARMVLEKRLPVAAGIGGGSADAASALRALSRLWRADIGDEALRDLAFTLGADVPACLSKSPVTVSGAGEIIAPGPALPPSWICLANPGVPMPTGPIFKSFDAANAAPPPPARVEFDENLSFAELAAALEKTRNDLQPHAIAAESIIGEAIDFLARCDGARAARMSGSGATVFALFQTQAGADKAARAAREKGWWSMSSRIAA